MSGSRAPYGHRRSDEPVATHPAEPQPGGYAGTTYYDRPALKPSTWGWLIVAYLWVGGLAGAAQLIATLTGLLGRERQVVRAGRYVALGGALASPVFLILDLHTPQRWYNMLRIFRRTSAMSIGSWTLTVFGTLSGLTALAQAADDLWELPGAGTVATVAGVPAAAAGAMMTVYTGVLLSATSIPLWSTADVLLPMWFGTSAVATATAALTLSATTFRTSTAGPALDHLALVAGGTELAVALATEFRWRKTGVAGPLDEPTTAIIYRGGVLGLGIILPVMIHLSSMLRGRHSKGAAATAAVATLIGGFALRGVLVFAGNESAQRPRDYFGITQTR